jgi:hypothetical protein
MRIHRTDANVSLTIVISDNRLVAFARDASRYVFAAPAVKAGSGGLDPQDSLGFFWPHS